MNEGTLTGIQLSKETRDRLKAMKVYARESYEEVINRLLGRSGRLSGGFRKAHKPIPQPSGEVLTEGQESALNEALDNDFKEA